MAVRLFSSNEVSDLCLGKPAIRSISLSDTVSDAIFLLKKTPESYVSVWNCQHSLNHHHHCVCVGKVCMLHIICFISKPHNVKTLSLALQSPISLLLTETAALVRHLPPNASFLEAIDSMYEGVQNLVIPIEEQNNSNTRKRGGEKSPFLDSNKDYKTKYNYCWLTQEDVIRYLLNSIGLFSPAPATPINTLNVIDTENLLAINYDDPASSALELLSVALTNGSSVAVVDSQGKFVGEISPLVLNSSDESIIPPIATLSAGDLMAYIDAGGPPEDLVQLVKERLEEHNLGAALEMFVGDETGLSSWSSYSSSSSDEEFCSGKNWKQLGGNSAKVGRRSEAIVCYPWSSLLAVMIQALAHRVGYVWVLEEDGTLTGIVTFQGILKVFREHLKTMS
ncbi:PREDICTED: CBS domain-containing protein CBSX5-like [Lupinus angustifolius]|uniref:CBS domain-containing protein CBSX5-like n=1 Tax=Lupinus angustifolius TaxID=3871 RepID=UPI00092E8916|nr:PREDICTED: CBS domain-containing protein CBSX5-like [Lupinus angustifolius]